MASKVERKQTAFRSIFASLMAQKNSKKSFFSVKKGTALVDVFWGEKYSFW